MHRNHLSLEDIDPQIREKIYPQDYSSKNTIDGVKIIILKSHVGEEGDFSEVIRVNEHGTLEDMPEFRVSQINRTHLIPGSLKAWHLHFKQDEVWYLVPSGHVLVGLWDIRQNSPTNGMTMRIVLGGGASHLLFIPKGVAHGSLNFATVPAELFYIVNQQFDINNPDEKRIPWDAKGEDFWKPQRD